MYIINMDHLQHNHFKTALIFLFMVVISVHGSCFIRNMYYPGNSINSGHADIQDTAEECQLLCQQTNDCNVFTWDSERKWCWLKTGISSSIELEGALSGPKFCAQPGTDASNNEADDQSSYEYNYDYDVLESEADHEAETNGEEEEEEPRPTFNPQFTTEAQHFKIPMQHHVRLPCRVDRLGPMVISWKKTDPYGENPEYLATGRHKLTANPRVSLVEIDKHGSTLVLDQLTHEDVGYYICEVSSSPPATLRHQVSINVPPTVKILKPSEDVYRIHAGQELALVCRGRGDPSPTLKWTRQSKRMPDGHNHIEGSQVIYKNITRKHSGTYVCEGSNGPGPKVKDKIQVDVLHPPEIVPEESYIERPDGVQLELVCIVHASPKPSISWYKDGQKVNIYPGSQNSIANGVRKGSNEENQRIHISKIGRKHLFIINRIMSENDDGIYTCHAVNDIGEAKHNFRVMTTENVLVRQPDSSGRSNLHHEDQNWHELREHQSEGGFPAWDDRLDGAIRHSNSCSALGICNRFFLNYLASLVTFIVLRYM